MCCIYISNARYQSLRSFLCSFWAKKRKGTLTSTEGNHIKSKNKKNFVSKSTWKFNKKHCFWSHFAAQAPTQRGLGDRKDATSDKTGPSGAAREFRERLFSVRGGFSAPPWAPRVVQERPREANSAKKEFKSKSRWLQKWCPRRYF